MHHLQKYMHSDGAKRAPNSNQFWFEIKRTREGEGEGEGEDEDEDEDEDCVDVLAKRTRKSARRISKMEHHPPEDAITDLRF
jgi:hypothetical protein